VIEPTTSKPFTAVSGVPTIHGHLELPDLRIEVETADGRLEYRNVALVTEHSRGQLPGQTAAGFARYRAAGARLGMSGRHAVRSA
jgi:hypothetical protein